MQVVMSDADLDEIRDAARRNNLTLSAWVRRMLLDAAGRDRRGGADAVYEARPDYAVFKPARCGTSRSRRESPSTMWRRCAGATSSAAGRRPWRRPSADRRSCR